MLSAIRLRLLALALFCAFLPTESSWAANYGAKMVEVAKSYVGNSKGGNFSGLCQMWVEEVLDQVVPKFVGTNYCCPREMWAAMPDPGVGLPEKRPWDPAAIQPGDVIIWDACFSTACGGPCGHIAVAAEGKGQMYSTDAGSGGNTVGLTDISGFCPSEPVGYLPMGGFACGDGSSPVRYGQAKNPNFECTPENTVDLSKAVAVIEWAIQSPPRFYSQTARWCSNAEGLCPSYDCSSLSSAVAGQVPGFVPDPAAWPGITTTMYAYSSPIPPGGAPVQWCFSAPTSSDIIANHHMYVRVGHYIGNAHGSSSTPNIDDQPSPGFYCRVPKSLEGLSDSCVCFAGGGEGEGTCEPGSGAAEGGADLGSCEDFFEHWKNMDIGPEYPATDKTAHTNAYGHWLFMSNNHPEWLKELGKEFSDKKGEEFFLSQGALVAGRIFAGTHFNQVMKWLLDHTGNDYCKDGVCATEYMHRFHHTMIVNPDTYIKGDENWGLSNKSCGGTNPGSDDCNKGGDEAAWAHCVAGAVCVDQNKCSSCQNGAACGTVDGCGGGKGCEGNYFIALGNMESGNTYSSDPGGTYKGRWANDVAFLTDHCGGAWPSNPNFCQDVGILDFTKGSWDFIVANGYDKKICSKITIEGKQYTVTQAGMLGATHLKGPGYLDDLLNGNCAVDGNGVSQCTYFKILQNTALPASIPWADNSCVGDIGDVGGSVGGSDGTCEPDCGNPALTGMFAKNPCSLPPPPTPPGKKFKDMIEKWWDNQFLPALKDMTTQLYSYRAFQTFQLGRVMDAENIIKTARVGKEKRIISQKDVMPNESVCVAQSAPAAIAQTNLASAALAQGFKKDVQRRISGVKTPAGAAPDFMKPGEDFRRRWKEYCDEFHDPASNDGKSACPGAGGGVVNGDINVEGFLFKDTIHMQNPHEYAAARALLNNLILPRIKERVPESVVVKPQGRERIIRQQHLEAINNIAADVVSSILSRRASMAAGSLSTAGHEVQDIRTKVGIPACSGGGNSVVCASATPSYNEIMRTMTKDRFFDPEYFFRIQNNPSSLKQEQASVDAYTSIQLQDIYTLQEQINALLAARAALKFKTDEFSPQTQASPLQSQ